MTNNEEPKAVTEIDEESEDTVGNVESEAGEESEESEDTAGGGSGAKPQKIEVTLLGYEWATLQDTLEGSSEYEAMPSMFVFGDLRNGTNHIQSQEPITLRIAPLDLYILQQFVTEHLHDNERLLTQEREEDEPDTQFIEDIVETHAILTTIMRKFEEQGVIYMLVVVPNKENE